jgi:hypothetical protein
VWSWDLSAPQTVSILPRDEPVRSLKKHLFRLAGVIGVDCRWAAKKVRDRGMCRDGLNPLLDLMERADPLKCFPGDRGSATIGDLVVNHEAGAAKCPEFTLNTN